MYNRMINNSSIELTIIDRNMNHYSYPLKHEINRMTPNDFAPFTTAFEAGTMIKILANGNCMELNFTIFTCKHFSLMLAFPMEQNIRIINDYLWRIQNYINEKDRQNRDIQTQLDKIANLCPFLFIYISKGKNEINLPLEQTFHNRKRAFFVICTNNTIINNIEYPVNYETFII